MITRDEALTLVHAWVSELWPRDPPNIDIHEFALGWVVRPTPATPQDPTREPSSTGRPPLVIDRENRGHGRVAVDPDVGDRGEVHRVEGGRR